jgi:hypothetical protein
MPPLEFPTLTRNDPFDYSLKKQLQLRMSLLIMAINSEIYESVGDNTSSILYRITGNDDTGYQAYVDDAACSW